MYFKKFPKLFYDFSTTNTQEIKYVTDIFHRVTITAEMVEKTSAYDKYIIKDGETAEIISHTLYGSPFYHWTIFLANDIINPYTDFPMTTKVFDEYVKQKYGVAEQNSPHHYTNSSGQIITPIQIVSIGPNCIYVPETATWQNVDLSQYNMVSNYDYEFALNESKRTINVIKPQFLSGIVSTFEDLMKQ